MPTQTISIKTKIQNTNTLIQQNASSGTYTLLETHPLFATADDTMKPEYTTDGLHLKESGYTIWAAYLKQQLPHLAN